MKDICNFIIKDQGICIYSEPEKPVLAGNFAYAERKFKIEMKYWKKDCEEAQSSAILCEDQERAKEIIKSKFGHDLDQMTINTKGYIYPVPGIEFEEVKDNCISQGWGYQCHKCGKGSFGEYCKLKPVARLIEHTADKESATGFTGKVVGDMVWDKEKNDFKIVKSKSPEIDKEDYRPTVATFEGHVLLLMQEFQEAHDEYQNNVSDTKVNPNGENTDYFRGKADAYGYAARQIRSMLRWHGKIDSDHP